MYPDVSHSIVVDKDIDFWSVQTELYLQYSKLGYGISGNLLKPVLKNFEKWIYWLHIKDKFTKMVLQIEHIFFFSNGVSRETAIYNKQLQRCLLDFTLATLNTTGIREILITGNEWSRVSVTYKYLQIQEYFMKV